MKTKSPSLKTVLHRVIEWIRDARPLDATTLGIHDQDHRVDDLGPARPVQAEQLLDLIRLIPDFSDPDDRLDAEALRSHLTEIYITTCEMDQPARSGGYMIDEFLYALFHQVNGSYAPPAERFRAVLYRLREVQRMLGQVLIALAESADLGRVPSAWTAHGMDVAEEGSQYLLALRRKLRRWLPSAAESSLRQAVADELTRASRAFLEYREDLRKRIHPKSSKGAYSAGAAVFDKLLGDVHLIGPETGRWVRQADDEAAETLARLETLSRKLCGTRNWHEADRQLSKHHPSAAGLIREFRLAVARLQKFVEKKKISNMRSAGTLSVIETPPFERASIPYAAYLGPAPFEQKDRHGYFFVTPPDRRADRESRLRHLREFPKAAISITAAHEGVPGHHLQHLIAHASPRPIRRLIWNSFFGEGWAHYCEGLMFNEGYERDDRTEFFLLKDRLWRCFRVSLDVQIHTRGMPLKQAAGILARDAGLSEEGAHGEIIRYSLEPTQPMSYFVGRKFIESLVDEEKRRRGPRFDAAAFHDRLLSFGAAPLSLVRQRLNHRA